MQSPIRAIVDTSALRHNLARVREFAPRARVMAVIKANAYGHGLEPVGRALGGADGLAVARLEEGIALRDAGCTGPVLLLEGVFDTAQLAAAVAHRLDVMVCNVEQLSMLEQRSAADPVQAWLKIDTGMNRLGFRADEFEAVHARLVAAPGVVPQPVLATHLACAEDRSNPRTEQQLAAFAAATAGVAGARSIANSAGLLAWPGARGDWLRPGLMLYGLSPFAEGCGADFGLRAAMRFESSVIAVRTVRAGETVGYCGTWRAERDTRLAVVAAGYGDGYPRNVPSGTPVVVAGHHVPLVGRVSMDMLTADVTDVPRVGPGDPVELWGARVPVEEVAHRAGTIPYELTCRVSSRVPREYR